LHRADLSGVVQVTSWWLAWRYVATLALLLAASVAVNVRQWSEHRAEQRARAAELQAAAYKAGLQVTASIAKQKQKDDPKLIEGMQRIEARVDKLASQQRPAPLPIQCAPGKARMDAVNAGADK
jgi:hypothetical protein